MLARIQALLAKAEATTFPEEAKIFTAKAQELMTKWAIDDAMLNRGKDVVGEIDKQVIWLDANEYRAPKVQLLAAVADTNNVKLVLHPQEYRMVDGKRKRMFAVTLVGFEKDRLFVEKVFTSLLLQLSHELLSPQVVAARQLECGHAGHGIKWRNTFTNGYAATIRYRLQQMRDQVRKQSEAQHGVTTLGLVLADRSAMVTRKYEEFFPKLGKAKKSDAGQGGGSAYYHGAQAGHRADVGSPKVKSGNSGLLN